MEQEVVVPPDPAASGPEAVPGQFRTPQGEDVRTLPLGQIGARIETFRAYQAELSRDRAFYEAEIVRRAVAARKARKLMDPEFDVEVSYPVDYTLPDGDCAAFREAAETMGIPAEEIDRAVGPPKTSYATKYPSAMKLAKDYGGALAEIVERFDVRDKDPKVSKCERRKKGG